MSKRIHSFCVELIISPAISIYYVAVIVSNDVAKRNLLRVVVIPLSTNTSKVYPGEALVTVDETRKGDGRSNHGR